MTRTLLALLMLVQCCSAPQHTGAGGGGASVTTGNALIVGCVASAASAPTITVSDTAGNTFNPMGSQLAWNSNGSFTEMFVALNVTGNSSDAITCNYSASVSYPGLVAVQYSGVATSSAVDVTNASGQCTNCNGVTSSSFTTAQAQEVIVAIYNANNSVTFTAGTGFTIEVQAGGTGSSGFALADEVTSAVQSAVSTSTSWSGASVPGAILVGSLK